MFLNKLVYDAPVEDCDALVGSFVGSAGRDVGFIWRDGPDGGDYAGDHGFDGLVVDV